MTVSGEAQVLFMTLLFFELYRALERVPVAVEVGDPVTRGELPWWHTVKDGIYRYGDDVVVIALGQSGSHHHIAEGFLQSKVGARLAVRKAAERIRWASAIPEPTLEDLFITRERTFYALYLIHVAKDAGVPSSIPTLTPPDLLRARGRRRVGRHVYEDDRHLYLECDVEGPVANPDWGRTRASARG
jgi:hypothetical protein